MKLSNVLAKPFTEEEYLAHQRQLHGEHIASEIALLRHKANDAVYMEQLRVQAELALEHRFILPGTGGKLFDIGTPPAWHECRTTNEEYLWVVNRTYWFSELTEMYVLTGERRYAEAALADIENWIDNCPVYPLPSLDASDEEFERLKVPFRGEVNPWRTFEVGVRTFETWNALYERLLMTDMMTPALHAKIAVSYYEHAKVLRTLTPRFFPNADHNHYLHEMLGLLRAVCVFPDIKEADAWREFALFEIGRCAEHQLTPDGGQIEGSPNYHSLCLAMFFDVAAIARTYHLTLPRAVLDGCVKGSVYETYTMMPSGTLVPVGDTWMGASLPHTAERYYRCFGELGPTENLFALFPNQDPLIIPEQMQQAARAVAQASRGGDNHQRQLGQYIARTGWKSTDSYLHFICCSPVNNGHAHQDPMSIVLTLQGDLVLVDPSPFTYEECPERKKFKSPEYHSCLTFDDKPPFEYLSRWSYSPQKEGSIRKSYRGEGFYAADASHHNYDPDLHKRLCMLVGDDTLVVADDVINLSGTDVRLWFHMDDPTVALVDGEARSERIRVLLPAGCDAQVLPSEKSPHGDVTVPTSRLCLTDTRHTHALYLTIFTRRADITSPAIRRVDDGVCISYKQGEQTKSFLWKFSSELQKM